MGKRWVNAGSVVHLAEAGYSVSPMADDQREQSWRRKIRPHSDGQHRLHKPERLGAPPFHYRDDIICERILRRFYGGNRGAYRNKNLQLGGYDVGRQNHLQGGDDVLHRVLVPIPDRGADGNHAGDGAV